MGNEQFQALMLVVFYNCLNTYKSEQHEQIIMNSNLAKNRRIKAVQTKMNEYSPRDYDSCCCCQ